MKLREIMTRSVESVNSDSTIQEAAQKMRAADVGMLPVLNGDRLVGVVTDRDIVVRAVSRGDSNRTVHEIMTPNPVCLDQDATVEDGIETMKSRAVGRLVVTDGGGNPVGVVSAGAIAIACEGRPEVGQLASDLSVAHRKDTVEAN